jgi:hypothetical protein
MSTFLGVFVTIIAVWVLGSIWVGAVYAYILWDSGESPFIPIERPREIVLDRPNPQVEKIMAVALARAADAAVLKSEYETKVEILRQKRKR